MSTDPSQPAGNLIMMPQLPAFSPKSPQIVRVFDEIRSGLDDDEQFAELCWFAREYPRCYRFHVKGAAFRLKSIHRLMDNIRSELEGQVREACEGLWWTGTSGERVEQVYWDFESFLSEINVALDLAARCVGPAFRQVSPPSFNRLCKWGEVHPLIDEFRRAKKNWVGRLKNYRDCFMHYTPVDTLLTVHAVRRPEGWALRAKLPWNPNSREILLFRYTSRTELLSYAIRVYKRLMAFDRNVARIVRQLYRAGEFPVRHERLFFIGARTIPPQEE